MNKEMDRLGKLVEMAKRGTPNEKETAERFIKKICDKHDLIFEEVMSKTELQEFELNYKKNKFKSLAYHIYARFGAVDKDNCKCGAFTGIKEICYKTTLSKHIEMLNAFDVLSKVYEEEEKLINESFALAFFNKHRLWFYTEKSDEERKQPTAEEIKKAMIANDMENNLQSVEILKRLENNKSEAEA